ncbi:hypothetical protein BGZ96_005404 [Linnemannia gamsii]|uniref:Uncharacterized protein n=1 Tax=Linnemannia gamsii TaxID=64522 RepID=A0ABQ7K5W3_9FUNG|nr:hypothetical protein BGZ96_005404 [Linnemannia gamsii]
MHFTTVTIASAVVAVASAQTLNPLYPFQPNGACVDACLNKAGKSMFDKFTNDPCSPDFMASLAFAHERGTPNYTKYMTDTGMCIMNCPKPEQELYNEQYKGKAAWYADKKANGTDPIAGNATLQAFCGSTTSGSAAKSVSVAVGVTAFLSAIVALF